jgi:GNAT superfamily N-acetyltransferase
MSVSIHDFDAASDGPALQEFIGLPARVYADDPKWIPTSPVATASRLLSGPIEEGHVWRPFLARRDGEAVACCAAVINPALQTADGRPVGTIGHFDALDDPEAIGALLESARGWLNERGRGEEVWGPFDYSIYHAYRFMVRGFSQDPFLGEPYNPPYYPERWRENGFTDHAQWFSWDLIEAHLKGMHEMSFALRSDILTSGEYTYRPFDVGEGFERDLRCVYDVLMPSFAPNVAATQVPFEAFVEAYGSLRSFVNPALMPLVVDPSGRVVGLGFLFPDPSAAFREIAGDVARVAEVPALLAANPPKRLVFHTMAVLEDDRRRGLIEAYMNQALENAFAAGVTSGVGALAKEGPTVYDKTGPSSRQYTLFRYGSG